MAQLVNTLAAEFEDLSLIQILHIMERENRPLPNCPLTSIHVLLHTYLIKINKCERIRVQARFGGDANLQPQHTGEKRVRRIKKNHKLKARRATE